jgi:hypothetical protein
MNVAEKRSKERVLAVYPDAFVWRSGAEGSTWFVSNRNEDMDYGMGATEAEAWDDAASKLPSPCGGGR